MSRERRSPVDYTRAQIAKMIDHSLLRPNLTDEELTRGCRLALEHRTASVCIKPYFVAQAARILKASGVRTGTTIGFPHGGHATAVKVAEAQAALDAGAEELDMVVNVGKVLSGDFDYVRADVAAVVEPAHARGAIVKVIFENSYLADSHKVRLCEICGQVGADFVKTSTGFAESGATLADVRLMRQHSPPQIQVKAAGGIRTLEQLLAFVAAGATRFGATRTVEILAACKD
jgi:deoxyribose-phosphate aldolase